jgi:chemotaxis protein CheD
VASGEELAMIAAEPPGKLAIVVGVADCAVGRDGQGRLITYALGSCIGITAYDPVARVGGLLHYMLPQPGEGLVGAPEKPCVYASTGVPVLLDRLDQAGAQQSRLIVCAAGGAEMLDPGSGAGLSIGRKNHAILRKALWKFGVALVAEDVGGKSPRNLSLDLRTGAVAVRRADGEATLWAPGSIPSPAKKP